MRNPLVDCLKAVASQIIVLHHLVLYSPMAKELQPLWPGLFAVLGDQARYVVQVFLVIGGYLAAQSMWKLLAQPQASELTTATKLIWQRYIRLAKPYWVAIAAAAALAAGLSWFDAFPDLVEPPTLAQIFSHIFMVHDIVGVHALSAGVWYVAIDFQLYALLVLMVWFSRNLNGTALLAWLEPARVWMLLALGLTVCSLFWWNTNPKLDEWGIYFFGAYGLGILSFWAVKKHRRAPVMALVACMVLAALWFNWRERLILTGITALLLMGSDLIRPWVEKVHSRAIQTLGDISYSVFLIHYPLLMLTSGVVVWLGYDNLGFHVAAFVGTWLLSIAAGAVMHHTIERSA
ncbi:acyltransferase [Limnobacter humi]|uniref:Acyltransferase n=1 Tax=Limnobacter humi TaxID=1778671 RepID=A0ABT1WG68_9BURK|nr:acyltransferase [Limnobacter humi]MCQ8895747.1 acyltransferase [Limnobacter humi]